MEDKVNHLCELQDYLLCMTHSRPGMRTYCHIECTGDGVKGGHCEISHQEITLWAQYIVSQRTESNGQSLPWVQKHKLATKTCLPNIKQFDDPPTKKHKVAQPALEFHIAVNLAPTLGGSALQGACVVSSSLLPQVVSASTPGPLHLGEVTSLDGDTRSSSAPSLGPLGHKIPVMRACKMLLQMLSEAAETRRAPRSYDILTWMDAKNLEVDGLYIDSFGNFKDLGIKDVFDIIETEVFYITPFGYLG